MSLRYVDIYRIPVKDYTRRGKTYLSMLQVKELLTGVIEVEEKIDGKRLRVPVEDYILYKEHCRQEPHEGRLVAALALHDQIDDGARLVLKHASVST